MDAMLSRARYRCTGVPVNHSNNVPVIIHYIGSVIEIIVGKTEVRQATYSIAWGLGHGCDIDA